MPAINAPEKNCQLCPRLLKFRLENNAAYPTFFNGAVPAFGKEQAALLIVGLAPGLKGANRTGRPFTGDYAGDLLYPTLLKFGLAKGAFGAEADDGLELINCRITNAVRCVPPQNKPIGEEMKNCEGFLKSEISGMANLKVIISLGRIAHQQVLRTLGQKQSMHPFAHNATHQLEGGKVMINSYHCSRYNTNTGRLTEQMFEAVFKTATNHL